MEGSPVQTVENKIDEFTLEEVRALRTEIESRIQRQLTFVGFFTVVASALATQGRLDEKLLIQGDVSLYWMLSFALFVIMLAVLEQDYVCAVIGRYIKDQIYPMAPPMNVLDPASALRWETYRDLHLLGSGFSVVSMLTAKYVFVLIPMFALDVLVLVHRDIYLANQSCFIVLGYLLWIAGRWLIVGSAARSTFQRSGVHKVR